ncbi:HD-GYP domain-containing protein [Evansella vedderi]|nr:HD-GYP domain-containing protein [Evansella vedderi]
MLAILFKSVILNELNIKGIIDEPLIYSIIGLLLILLVAIKFTDHFSRSLKELTSQVNLVASSDNEVIQEFEGQCEISELSQSINETIKNKEKIIEEKSKEIQEITQSLNSLYLNTVISLSRAVDAKDKYTGSHSSNVARYSYAVAKKLDLNDEESRNIYIAGLLHDIGKIATPESILNKESNLTKEEFEKIKEHPEVGYKIVRDIEELNKRGVCLIVRHHHERIDGRGYPSRLEGEDIPIGARIVAVADAYDAMTTDRSYRAAFTHSQALEIIRNNSGTQFDPKVVDAFIKSMETQNEIIPPEKVFKVAN